MKEARSLKCNVSKENVPQNLSELTCEKHPSDKISEFECLKIKENSNETCQTDYLECQVKEELTFSKKTDVDAIIVNQKIVMSFGKGFNNKKDSGMSMY